MRHDGDWLPEGQFLWEASAYDLRLLKRVEPDYMLPPGYGVAWHEFYREAVVCAPIPLNFVLGWAVRAWWRLKGAPAHCARCGR